MKLGEWLDRQVEIEATTDTIGCTRDEAMTEHLGVPVDGPLDRELAKRTQDREKRELELGQGVLDLVA
jgi:hypothetical protein